VDNPALIIALIAAGVALNLGFFFVHAMTPSIAVTMFGIYLRDRNPTGYWFWRTWHAVSFTFNMLLAIAVIIGLLQ
jgi:hypothetical protein